MSKAVGPQMAWATASHHKGAVVSIRFLTQEEAKQAAPVKFI